MITNTFTVPLKLASAIVLASLLVIWWAADRADQSSHAATAGAVLVVIAVTALLVWRSETLPGLDAARRAAARYALLVAMVYLWGSVAILVSYYLTDLRWYHTYQYATYLAIPGFISLYVYRRHLRPASADAIARELDIGRWMAIAQLIVMLGALVYIWMSREVAMGLAGENENWAAVAIMLCGTLALTLISLLAIDHDIRLRRKER